MRLSRPLFDYFRLFHTTFQSQIEKIVDIVLGIRTRGSRMGRIHWAIAAALFYNVVFVCILFFRLSSPSLLSFSQFTAFLRRSLSLFFSSVKWMGLLEHCLLRPTTTWDNDDWFELHLIQDWGGNNLAPYQLAPEILAPYQSASETLAPHQSVMINTQNQQLRLGSFWGMV